VITAIGVKLDYAYLDELSRSLQFLKYPKSPINFKAVNSFTAQVNAERVKVIPHMIEFYSWMLLLKCFLM
jgi:hypothetical protein